MDTTLFYLALIVSLVASGSYVLAVFRKRVREAKTATWILLASFFLLTASFGYRCLTLGESGLLGAHGIWAFFAWSIMAGYLALQMKTKTRILGVLVAPLVSLILAVASAAAGQAVSLPEILQGALVPVHVILTLTGEALLLITFLAGITYLYQSRAIKYHRFSRMTRLFPSLADLDRINHISAFAGLILLTFGIIAGVIWAGAILEGAWWKDAKFIWAGFAWVAFGILVFQRIFMGWQGARPAWFSCLSFTALLISFFAVKLFLPSIHRFI